MFTGIVKSIGKIKIIDKNIANRIMIVTKMDLSDIMIGSSVSCSGVCLTVVKKSKSSFWVDLSEETCSITTAGTWSVDKLINLEKSLKVGDELAGHFVTGHVDCIAKITNIESKKSSKIISVSCSNCYLPLISQKGSVTIDGVSLTVNKIDSLGFKVSIIPHTEANTTFKDSNIGDKVNMEVDIISRYVANSINNIKNK